MYSTPIQYMDELYNSDKKDALMENTFVLTRLVKLYENHDVQSLRDFMGWLNFTLATEEKTPLALLTDELRTLARLMIEEVQRSIYKDRTNGLKLVK